MYHGLGFELLSLSSTQIVKDAELSVNVVTENCSDVTCHVRRSSKVCELKKQVEEASGVKVADQVLTV